MLFGTPNFSIISIALGKAASDDAVVKANIAGSFIARTIFLNEILIILHTITRTKTTKTSKEKYVIVINFA